jgi:sugar fermentation stimulation protein A
LSSKEQGKGGAYLLVLGLHAPARILVGSLGAIDFPRGTYAYSGGALTSLQARVARHFSTEKKVHWHIDHLRSKADPVEALVLRSEEDLECMINEMVASLDGALPFAPGFGCSDCRCKTHLHRLDRRSLHALERFFPERMVPQRDEE